MILRKQRSSDLSETNGHKRRDNTGDIIKLVTAILIAYGGGALTVEKYKAYNSTKVSVSDVITKEQAMMIKDRVYTNESGIKAVREITEEKFKTVQVQLNAINDKIDYLIRMRNKGDR